jgi:acetylornithine deacetylase/succinyl-diaminopimelate desuccinylase-like protein
MASPIEYAHQHANMFRQQLFDLIRIPSVSTDPDHAVDVQRAAQWIANAMENICTHSEIIRTAGHPVVYGEWLGAGDDAPTVLVYGHYDVQPADFVKDGWTSQPFEPVVRNNVVYARGSSDDKGQMFIHLKALESYLKTVGSAPVNLKFIFEGEEEIGSPNLVPFVVAHRDRLKADVCVISDTGMGNIDEPSITYGLRGLCYMELHVTGPRVDMHSGFGGMVHNPALAIAQIISKLHNPDGSIAVPGFYDDVVPLTPDEREVLQDTDITEDELKQMFGVPAAWGEPSYTLVERSTARPTLEINGLYSGFIGEGSKTVLPGRAMAKRDDPAMQAAFRAYERGWGKRPNFRRSGGSIPIVADFRRELGVPVILMGYGLETDGAHGPDEHYSLEMFERGIDTAICFLEEIAK